MHGSYFEAILQLRNPPDTFHDVLQAYLVKRGVEVTKEEHRKDGVDLFITRQRETPGILRLLKEFGADVKASERLFSQDRQTSKQLFRVTIFAKFPLFKVGDVVEASDKPILVSSLGKRLLGTDVSTGKKVSLPMEATLIETLKSRVVTVHPELTVMDPETYQSVRAKANRELNLGEKVEIVLWKGVYYCF